MPVRATRVSNIQHNISLGDIMKLRTIHGVESVHILFFIAQRTRLLKCSRTLRDL